MKGIVKTVIQPDWVTIQTENEIITREYRPDEIYGKCIQVEIEVSRKKTDIWLASPHMDVKWVILRWNERILSSGKVMGDAWEQGYGNFEWRCISVNRYMPWYFIAECMGGFIGTGVMTNPSAMCFWQADTAGITLYMDVRCGGQGVLLGERRLKICSVIQRLYNSGNAFDVAKAFCSSLCVNPMIPKMPIYGSNNRHYAYGNNSQEDILKDTEYLARLTKKCNSQPYMILNNGWQEQHQIDRYNGGPWRKGNEKIQDMKKLAAQMKKQGVNPGIWIRPLYDQITKFPEEWKLLNTKNLDPSHPDVIEHIKKDVETICRWGYKLIKYDYVTYDIFGRWGCEMNPSVTDGGWHFYNKGMTSAEIVKKLYEEIWKTAVSYDVILFGCNTIGHLGAGFMHINRIVGDISGKEWEWTRNMGVNSLAFRLCQNETFYLADADSVRITGHIPWELSRQWADVIARSGTPLFVSVDPCMLQETQNEELANILKIASECRHHMQPLDWMFNNCPDTWIDEDRIIDYKWYQKSGLTFINGK